MHATNNGFTLVELMIVTAVIAILAAIAVPYLISARINANEGVAIATLRNLMAAQAQARSSGTIDSNGDGVGEYGYFQELSGLRDIRRDTDGDGLADGEGTVSVSPPVISTQFGEVDGQGLLQRSGYMFRVYLPGTGGQFERELAPWDPYGAVSATMAANYWACYAWPVHYGTSGKRAFFVNNEGQILVCNNNQTRYSGYTIVVASFLPFQKKPKPPKKKPKRKKQGSPPDFVTSPTAAFLAGSTLMSGRIAVNTIGQDGNLWSTVQ